jgi:hypothetical protein
MLGKFPRGHGLAGQQRMIVLKVNENYSSLSPSCRTERLVHDLFGIVPDIIHDDPPPHVLPQNERMENILHLDDNDNLVPIWALKQCPHCGVIYHRDVNACR